MDKYSISLNFFLLTLSILHSSSFTTGQQWITRFHPIESQFELIASSPLLPSDSTLVDSRSKVEYFTSTISPTTTTFAPVVTSTERAKARRVPLKSTVLGSPRKPYEPRNASINRKKIYEFGNQHQPRSPGHVHRKRVIYFKSNKHQATNYDHISKPRTSVASNWKQNTLPQGTFIAYPIVYHRSKSVQRKWSNVSKKGGERESSLQVGQVSSNPPEQIAPVNPPTVTVTAPKFIRRKSNGRSASLLDLESSRLSPDRSLGNDMLYYPEPSSDDDSGSSSIDKNGISNDRNSEFVIIK